MSRSVKEILELAAAGVVRLPAKPFRLEEILALPEPKIPLKKLLRALREDREEN